MNEPRSSPPDRRLSRTQVWIAGIAGLPTVLLLIGLVVPPNPPKDAIAVSTLFLVFLGAPLFSVAGLLIPLIVPREYWLRRRMVRAVCFSIAALLLVADFWLMGIGAGLARSKWNIWTIPAAILVMVAIGQIPIRDPNAGDTD